MKHLLLAVMLVFSLAACDRQHDKDEPQRTPGNLLPGGDVIVKGVK